MSYMTENPPGLSTLLMLHEGEQNMNDVLKEIKDSWDQLSDSAWYRSLRTDGKIAELMEDPASAFHPLVSSRHASA